MVCSEKISLLDFPANYQSQTVADPCTDKTLKIYYLYDKKLKSHLNFLIFAIKGIFERN